MPSSRRGSAPRCGSRAEPNRRGSCREREQVELDDPGHAPYALRMEVDYHPVLEQVVNSTAWMRVEGGTSVSSPRSTAYAHDALGRITAIAEPGDVIATPTQEFAYEIATPVSRIVTRRRTVSGSSSADLEAVQCFDGLGRKFQERTLIEAGRYQVSGHQALRSGVRRDKPAGRKE